MKIFIQGIKTIREGQFISIGKKLTFLVGPNSAGKSTLLTALESINDLLDGKELTSHFVHKNPNNNFELSGTYSLGLEFKTRKGDVCIEISSMINSEIYEDEIINQKGVINQKKYTPTTLTEPYYAEYTNRKYYYINDQLKIRTEGIDERMAFMLHVNKGSRKLIDKYSSISIPSPEIKSFCNNTELTEKFKEEIRNIRAAIQSRPMTLESHEKNEELLIRIDSEMQKIESDLKSGLIRWNYARMHAAADLLFSGKQRQRILNFFEKFNATIIKYRNKLNREHFNPYNKIPASTLISADRVLPSKSDCNLTFKPENEFQNIYHKIIAMNHPLAGHPSYRSGIPSLEKINKALSDNLFHDNGYQIMIDFGAFISAEDILEGHPLKAEDITEETTLHGELYLIDSHGRKLSFSDVGSGIGYVLPILAESFTNSSKNNILFIQQPELHLHPAMQANLADVLIEAAVNKKIIAETHSEHMILRALKRIRQTARGYISDPALRLKSDDIAINYFEPLPDGSTKIHILRVTQDGDFLDRWPNGFFPEREQELFDE